MNRQDCLRKIDKNIRGAIEVADLFLPNCTKRQKLAWHNTVGQYLQAAQKNIVKLQNKPNAKEKNKTTENFGGLI